MEIKVIVIELLFFILTHIKFVVFVWYANHLLINWLPHTYISRQKGYGDRSDNLDPVCYVGYIGSFGKYVCESIDYFSYSFDWNYKVSYKTAYNS